MKFIQAVLNKSEWRKKLTDPEIVSRWEAEAESYHVRAEVFDYAIEELNWLANAYDDSTGIEPTGVDFVWVSTSSHFAHSRNRSFVDPLLISAFRQSCA